jgi:adenylate cyclase, class 2
MTGNIETEVKIHLSDPDRIEKVLRSNEFREKARRIFEANTLYDTPDFRLRSSGTLLRLREIGSKGVITWKGPSSPGPHKSRPEIETTVGSVEQLHKILTNLGFQASFRYEKYRTEYESIANPEGVITFDETPIGHFLELEGSGEWIDQMAQRLGFSPAQYVLESYGRLYIADCKRRGVEPANMIFPSGDDRDTESL